MAESKQKFSAIPEWSSDEENPPPPPPPDNEHDALKYDIGSFLASLAIEAKQKNLVKNYIVGNSKKK